MTAVKVERHERFENVFWLSTPEGERRLATLNLTPGVSVYDEPLFKVRGKEYRLWDAYRSKLAAAILKGVKVMPIKVGLKVLYLGAASGTTASHVSDMVGDGGRVYAVEFAHRVIRELIDNVCAHRRNIIPIMEDARFPRRYRASVGKVDTIYCDIAQPEQARILVDNAETYLGKGAAVMIALKARSVDVTMTPSQVFRQEVEVLKRGRFEVKEVIRLEPYERDHAMVTAEKG